MPEYRMSMSGCSFDMTAAATYSTNVEQFIDEINTDFGETLTPSAESE